MREQLLGREPGRQVEAVEFLGEDVPQPGGGHLSLGLGQQDVRGGGVVPGERAGKGRAGRRGGGEQPVEFFGRRGSLEELDHLHQYAFPALRVQGGAHHGHHVLAQPDAAYVDGAGHLLPEHGGELDPPLGVLHAAEFTQGGGEPGQQFQSLRARDPGLGTAGTLASLHRPFPHESVHLPDRPAKLAR